jgi:hypothetical protein
MALTIPYQRINAWWQCTGTAVAAWWDLVLAGARWLQAALVRLWRWLLAEPDRFRAASTGLAVCLLVGAVIGWVVGALLTETVAGAVHYIRTGP